MKLKSDTNSTFVKKIDSSLKQHFLNKYYEKTFQTTVINNIIYNEKAAIVANFKDFLIFDDTSEFLKRFYKRIESAPRLNKIYDFYSVNAKIYPNYTAVNEAKYIYKNIQRKQKMIDSINRNNKLNLNLCSSNDKSTNAPHIDNNQIFHTEVYNSIMNITLTKNENSKVAFQEESEELNQNILGSNALVQNTTTSFENLIFNISKAEKMFCESEKVANLRKENANDIEMPIGKKQGHTLNINPNNFNKKLDSQIHLMKLPVSPMMNKNGKEERQTLTASKLESIVYKSLQINNGKISITALLESASKGSKDYTKPKSSMERIQKVQTPVNLVSQKKGDHMLIINNYHEKNNSNSNQKPTSPLKGKPVGSKDSARKIVTCKSTEKAKIVKNQSTSYLTNNNLVSLVGSNGKKLNFIKINSNQVQNDLAQSIKSPRIENKILTNRKENTKSESENDLANQYSTSTRTVKKVQSETRSTNGSTSLLKSGNSSHKSQQIPKKNTSQFMSPENSKTRPLQEKICVNSIASPEMKSQKFSLKNKYQTNSTVSPHIVKIENNLLKSDNFESFKRKILSQEKDNSPCKAVKAKNFEEASKRGSSDTSKIVSNLSSSRMTKKTSEIKKKSSSGKLN